MGADKGLALLQGKPLVAHVAERLATVVDEVIVVVSTEDQAKGYRSYGLLVVADAFPSESPIVGAYTGLAVARGGFTFIAGGDQPLLNPRVVELLFDEAEGHDAATPYWPNGWVEPLNSAYRTERAAAAALQLVKSGENRLRRLIDSLPDARRVPIDDIKAIDPDLRTLMDVDTPEEFERIRRLAE